jgi:hypothetical protein
VSRTDLELFYGRRNNSATVNLGQECRRFPLWLGNMRDECTEHAQWKPQRPWWWLDDSKNTVEALILGGNKNAMAECMEKEFLEFMKSWPEYVKSKKSSPDTIREKNAPKKNNFLPRLFFIVVTIKKIISIHSAPLHQFKRITITTPNIVTWLSWKGPSLHRRLFLSNRSDIVFVNYFRQNIVSLRNDPTLAILEMQQTMCLVNIIVPTWRASFNYMLLVWQLK